MIRSTLIFTFTLLLIGCSDNATKTSPSTSTSQLAANPLSKQIDTTTEPAVQVVAKAPQTDTQKPMDKTVNGHTVFALKCASCHGHNGEKNALNKSKVIAGWQKEKIYHALKGYQSGSYGGKMKAIMKGQAGALNDKQIEAVAAYIATL